MIRPLSAAVRRLARSPRLSIAAVLCIAVGVAAASAALTLVSATLLRPLPYPDADRLVRVWLERPGVEERIELSYPDVRDLRAASLATIDAVEASARARVLFRGEGGTRRVEGEAVTPGYFELVGVRPIAGRLFTPEEYRPGAEPVVLLSYEAWGSELGFSADAVGSALLTDRGALTVVGVLPESFAGTVEEDSGDIELWLPIEAYLSPERRESRQISGIWSLARLAPDGTAGAAAAEIAALGERIAEADPENRGDHVLTVEPVGENWRSRVRRGSLLLLAASGLLLLVAATNVAVLLLARAMGDQRELAIRAALGAGRRRMLGQTLLETVLLVAAGGLLGLLAGPALLRWVLSGSRLVDGSMLGLPVFVRLELDPLAVTLAVFVMLVAALVAGLGPAVMATRADPARSLQDGGRGMSGGRRSRLWTGGLVFAEVALTTVLVVGAVLLVRSYSAMLAEDLGFRSEGVLRIALFVNEEDVRDEADLGPFYQRVRRELGREPAVEEVGVVWPTVPIDWPRQEPFTAPGLPPAVAEGGLRPGVFLADAEYFEVLDLAILAGRGFSPADGPGAPAVALVNRALAERVAGAAGFAAAVDTEATLSGEPVRIVGVVEDARYGGPREEEVGRYEVYLPFARDPQRLMSLMIATDGEPASLVPALTRRLRELAPVSATDWVGPVDGWVHDLYLLDSRFLLTLIALFSAAGLFLSAVGLFAVLADSVARRRSELGIRQALGATPRRIQAIVVAQGVKVVILGLAAGAVLAWASSELLASSVYGVVPTDPWSFAAAGALLLTVALLASFLPARRAAAIDPARVLHEE